MSKRLNSVTAANTGHSGPRFVRYLQLYVLHHVQASSANGRILEARVITAHYALSDLPLSVDTAWDMSPSSAVDAAREWIVPRLEALQEDRARWHGLWHNAQRWRPYLALQDQRALPSAPDFMVPRPPDSIRPGLLNRRLDQAERLLRLGRTTLEMLNAGLVLWQSWQQLRDEQRLRQDAIAATLDGQAHALQNASNRDFVQGYLDAHQDDEGHWLIFSPDNQS
ncbi:MAG: hypothetical protein GYB66_13020 [Chloroflexi bacterium]|nr:hypothetical protein [Chloroflexota bacterium]